MRSLLRPRAIWPAVGIASRAPPAARSLYTLPTLDDHKDLIKNGLKGLFTPEAFKVAYTDYQQFIIDQINEAMAGNERENQDMKSLVVEYARDPARAHQFNVASMAWNNHFFFHGLNTNPDVQVRPSNELELLIKAHFSSMETLRADFLNTAQAMFGPGFVWLVQTDDTEIGNLRILTTYLAGSPLSAAHYRRQSHDLSTSNVATSQKLNSVGSFGPSVRLDVGPKKPLGGIDIVPLLCVNTWEHVWLTDYKITGKRKFLDDWWEKINWEKVRELATLPAQPKQPTRQFLHT